MNVKLKLSCAILCAVMLIAGSSCGNKETNSSDVQSVSSKIASIENSSETKSQIASVSPISSEIISSEVAADVTVTSQTVGSGEVSSQLISSEEISSVSVSSIKEEEQTSSISIPIDIDLLDNTRSGWGPGKVTNHNRPPYAVSNSQKYKDYNALFIGDDCKKVYLTFDEGYENGYTAQILDVLKEKDVKAVFFITMQYAKDEPELVQRMIDEGHVVGNHSVRHKSMPTLSVDEMTQEVLGLHEYILQNFGYQMTLFRPPMGEYSEQSLSVLQNLGYKSVMWSFAHYDYDPEKQPEHQAAHDKILAAAHGGAIYLLHAVSKTNTEILGDVIDAFRAEGYELALMK